MEAVKYDVKTLSYVPTDAVALTNLAERLAKANSDGGLAPINTTNAEAKEAIEEQPYLKPGIMPLEGTADVYEDYTDLTEFDKPALQEDSEDCPCAAADGECGCELSFFDKVKEKAKDNWKWLAIGGGALILGFILFKVFKK